MYVHNTQESSNPRSQSKAVDLIKYFDRLYRNSPDFRTVASSQEFIDSLASVLFPPITFSESEDAAEGDTEWVRVCAL